MQLLCSYFAFTAAQIANIVVRKLAIQHNPAQRVALPGRAVLTIQGFL
ncbi:MAG: hypothetical protein JO251_18790 [Verrucomicrobia bacterium]|nr:hypothetical protein [Verrucomicrobiota bacterium]